MMIARDDRPMKTTTTTTTTTPTPPTDDPSHPQSSTTSSSSVDVDLPSLCDDALHRVLSYADLPSLVRVAMGTCRGLRRRLRPRDEDYDDNDDDDRRRDRGRRPDVWRTAFEGHNLAPIDDDHEGDGARADVDYLDALRLRLSLWSHLRGGRRSSDASSTTTTTTTGGESSRIRPRPSPSDRSFRFRPLVPQDMTRYHPDDHDNDDRPGGWHDDDPPPVEFACDSFSLTSPGVGAEYVLLDPFSGSISVYDSVLDDARTRAASDEDDGDEDDEGGRANHDTPPRRTLFSVDDYFGLDLEEYFGAHTPFSVADDDDRRGRRRRRMMMMGNDDATVDWIGLDSRVSVDDRRGTSVVARRMIGAARVVVLECDRAGGGGRREDLVATEILAWDDGDDDDGDDVNSGRGGDTRSAYDHKYVCRVAGTMYFLDVCASHRKVYAAFQIGRCPFRGGDVDCMGPRPDDNRRRAMDIDDESMVNEDGESIRMSRSVFCLPLVGYDVPPSSPEAISSYFPSPDACITAQYPVSSFSVDPTGRTIVIGTICGTVEIWRTGMDRRLGPKAPLRVQILSVRESFVMRHRAMTMKARRRPITPCGNDLERKINISKIDDDANETVDDLALLDNGTLDEVEFPHKHPTCKISHMYIPPHLPVQKCGFVTKQRCPENGTTLLLWQTPNMSSDKHHDTTEERFHITAMINLPLSAQCRPEVHFDGRRLIVFGKDHIGLIILVYHVLGTRYDQNNFDSPNLPNGEESGGVVQLSGERRIRFVNRIRHAGLGGLEYFDSMLMAANERFIVVNTKTGNLIGSDGARNATEGLLVIDLLEQYDRCS